MSVSIIQPDYEDVNELAAGAEIGDNEEHEHAHGKKRATPPRLGSEEIRVVRIRSG